MEQKIETITWYMGNDNDNAYYEVVTNKGSFSIKDTNDVPLLGNNQESKEWVIEHYSIFGLLF